MNNHSITQSIEHVKIIPPFLSLLQIVHFPLTQTSILKKKKKNLITRLFFIDKTLLCYNSNVANYECLSIIFP